MSFGSERTHSYKYSYRYYEELLIYIQDRYRSQYWNALPREIARYYVSMNPQR
jgi:hypothetical protein